MVTVFYIALLPMVNTAVATTQERRALESKSLCGTGSQRHLLDLTSDMIHLSLTSASDLPSTDGMQ